MNEPTAAPTGQVAIPNKDLEELKEFDPRITLLESVVAIPNKDLEELKV